MNSCQLLASLCMTILILTGCAAPTQRMADEDRKKITSVRMHPNQEKATGLFLLAPGGANIGLMFGAVGALAASGSIQSAASAFEEFLAKNNISVEKIVQEEIAAAVREAGKFSVVAANDESAPAIKVLVQQYGFGVPHLLSSKVVPTMMIKCEMVDQSGRVVWSAGDRVLTSVASQFEAVTWDEMRDNPKRIEEEWRKAAKYLAKRIIAEL